MPSYLESTGLALLNPLENLWNTLVEVIPGVLAAAVVVVIGYIIASAFGLLFHRLLIAAKVDHHLKKAGLAHSIGFINIASLGAALAKWWIFTLFLVQAAGFLRFGVISDLLVRLTTWLPSLYAAILIMLGGLIFADYLADRMLHAKRKGVRLVSSLVRWSIIIFVGLIALERIGVDVSFATNTILLVVAGFSVGIALAIGIGFGLALKDEAQSMVKQWKKNL